MMLTVFNLTMLVCMYGMRVCACVYMHLFVCACVHLRVQKAFRYLLMEKKLLKKLHTVT